MKIKRMIIILIVWSTGLFAEENNTTNVQKEIEQLKVESAALQQQLQTLQQSLHQQQGSSKKKVKRSRHNQQAKHDDHFKKEGYHVSPVRVRLPNKHPEPLEFYPTALLADEEVITYIAGTPVITSPYLGARPAFDGSDYIVNISSINRDLRLMQQRRNLYKAYEKLGSPPPDVPIIALSGKVEPVIMAGRNYFRTVSADLTLGSDELDVAAILNQNVEAYMGIAYDSSPPEPEGQRVSNSGFSLNMGFVNIGNLERTPFYLTAGQMYVPFGRFSTAMVNATLPMLLSRTKSRPIVVGYKSQAKTGPIVSLYGFRSDTVLESTGVGGVNAAYIFEVRKGSGEIGASLISAVNDSTGMQYTNAVPGTTFGGFASLTNGTEEVKKIPAVDVHANMSVGRYSFTGEWVSTTHRFRTQDLSFNGHGALPQAAQGEIGMTFRAFDKPASIAAGYQWSAETLALNIPQQRINAVFNISIWEDTLESIEYRHDIDFGATQYANGANAPGFPPNQNTIGSGGTADSIIAQLGIFF